MPTIYISPSTQEYNPYVTGNGSEEYQMNLLADAMEPYLYSNAIGFTRNRPDMTAASSVRQANQGNYDFYLALHSNASGTDSEGKNRGIIAFYYPTSTKGKEAAEIFAANFRDIYPLPDQVSTRSTTSLIEVKGPKAPAVLLEIGYHDNYSDAVWVENNLDLIAQSIVRSLTELFGLPFIYPQTVRYGAVNTPGGGSLKLRAYPSAQGAVISEIPDGSSVEVYGEYQGWYTVRYGNETGYADGAYIAL